MTSNGNGPDPKTEEMNARNRVIVKAKADAFANKSQPTLFHVQGDWHGVDVAIVAIRLKLAADETKAKHLMLGDQPTGLGAFYATPHQMDGVLEQIGSRGDRAMFQFAEWVFQADGAVKGAGGA